MGLVKHDTTMSSMLAEVTYVLMLSSLSDVRPVSPTVESNETVVKVNKLQRPTERKMTAVNTELLFRLFETIDVERKTSRQTTAAPAAATATTGGSKPTPPKILPHPPVQRRHR